MAWRLVIGLVKIIAAIAVGFFICCLSTQGRLGIRNACHRCGRLGTSNLQCDRDIGRGRFSNLASASCR